MRKHSKEEMRDYIVGAVTTLPDELVHEAIVSKIMKYLDQEELFDELYQTSEEHDLYRIVVHLYGFCEMFQVIV